VTLCKVKPEAAAAVAEAALPAALSLVASPLLQVSLLCCAVLCTFGHGGPAPLCYARVLYTMWRVLGVCCLRLFWSTAALVCFWSCPELHMSNLSF
jgi:hypothetical protein